MWLCVFQSSLWSDSLEVMSGAAPPDTPSVPLVTCRSSHHATVYWDEPCSNGAPVTDYRLEMSLADREQDYTTVFHGLSNSYEAKGLTAATAYYFRIQVWVSSAHMWCHTWHSRYQQSVIILRSYCIYLNKVTVHRLKTYSWKKRFFFPVLMMSSFSTIHCSCTLMACNYNLHMLK